MALPLKISRYVICVLGYNKFFPADEHDRDREVKDKPRPQLHDFIDERRSEVQILIVAHERDISPLRLLSMVTFCA